MGAIRHTTKREVLQRVATLLESSHAVYKSRVFVMCGNELPPNIKDHDLLTVSIAGGAFSYREQQGSGENIVPYQGTLQVSLWHTCRTDRQGVDKDLLLAEGMGLFRLQANVLRTMIGQYLHGDEVYDPILTQGIYAVSDTEASRAADGVFGRTPAGDMAQAVLTTNFGTDFHWDLTAE